MKQFVKNGIYWLFLFFYYVFLILAIGSLAGAFLFATLGILFSEKSLLALLKQGIGTGFRYAGIWAGGLAIVLCFMKAGRKRKITNEH